MNPNDLFGLASAAEAHSTIPGTVKVFRHQKAKRPQAV